MKAAEPARQGVCGTTPTDYLIDNPSDRAVNFILSTARSSAIWAGVSS